MVTCWRAVEGFEGRYEVSDAGEVRSLPFLQRWVTRNGRELYRRTRMRTLATQQINSGYAVVHLHLNNKRTPYLLHRLVAAAFVENPRGLPEVNHLDGDKRNCRAGNLEWVTRRENHLHAVLIGLNKQAIRVRDPDTGVVYFSLQQATQALRKCRRTVLRDCARVGL